jgi:hypothetical protein
MPADEIAHPLDLGPAEPEPEVDTGAAVVEPV